MMFNAFSGYIMQSQEYKDALLKCFKNYIDEGYNPNDCIEKVFREVGCDESDLTDPDIKDLISKVERYYRQSF